MGAFDDILEQARPGTRPVRLCLRGDLVDRLRALEGDLAAAVALAEMDAADDGELAYAAAQAIVELEREMDAQAVLFTVRAIPQPQWQALLRLHPPSEDDRAAGWGFGAGFANAAIAATTTTTVGDEVDQPLSLEQVGVLATKITDGQYRRLWSSTLDLNTGTGDLPKSAAAYAVMAASALRSRTASLTASPTQSS